MQSLTQLESRRQKGGECEVETGGFRDATSLNPVTEMKMANYESPRHL